MLMHLSMYNLVVRGSYDPAINLWSLCDVVQPVELARKLVRAKRSANSGAHLKKYMS
jgi:hypothetical protein